MIQAPFCEICGIPISRSGLCRDCKSSRPPFEAMRSWSIFEGPIRNALHKLKYRRNLALGDALACQLAEFVRSLSWPVNLVVPVPLGKQRLRERGYNQVGLVALPLAAMLGRRYAPRAVVRSKDTRSQVGLSAPERKENVSGAFTASPEIATNRTVLLIDDVATTGATLSSCARALLAAGAPAVYALTLARALPQPGFSKI
jgi:competence protein ComFC